MNRHKTATAACVNSHAGAMKVEEVRDSICHNGNAVSSSSVLRLPIRISETDLLVV